MPTEIDYSAARKEMARQNRISKIRSNENAKEARDSLVDLLKSYTEFVEAYIANPSATENLSTLIESSLLDMKGDVVNGYHMYERGIAKAKKKIGCRKQHVVDWAVSEVGKRDNLSDSARELLEEGDNWIIRKIIGAGLSISELPPIVLGFSEFDMDWACGLKEPKKPIE